MKANDIAVLTLGRVSGEGCDRRVEDFLLKENELALIKQVSAAYHAAGKKLVVVLNICSPVETASWKMQWFVPASRDKRWVIVSRTS